MTRERILAVCTGNICRSPVAAELLRKSLAGTEIDVDSAGTRAVPGSPPSQEALDYLLLRAGVRAEAPAVQLSEELAVGSSLVITMTEEQRAWVARRAPRAVRRTFTLLELARITALLEPHSGFASVQEFARRCAPLRPRVRVQSPFNDIPDPYGGPYSGYIASFDTVAESIDAVSDALLHGTAA
jgi:protein-tyrosine phosphatase